MAKGITARNTDYSQWYLDIIKNAGLAENAPVKGCMVIKPYGYTIWERMQSELDARFKETGHVNAYFPLFIPKSFLSKEASHIEGFAKECAVVTHYRLINDPNGSGVIVDPTAKLEEELIVRPTSETVIWSSYKNWVQSYRDLPLLINQWANVVRWEMRTRIFLRTTEFLWQEGHTAHSTAQEAVFETKQMLDVYAEFAETVMAMPVIKGVKTANERFAGAVDTYCIEALMQDGKALQAGTSHFLGQNFAKAFDVKYATKDGGLEYVWGTSWGVSTRLMGALIMAHSDDDGLVVPPKLAPIQVVLIPIYRGPEQLAAIEDKIQELAKALKAAGIRIKVDIDDTQTPGWKYAEYEMKGVPLRLALGARDVQNGTIEAVRRDTKTKQFIATDNLVDKVQTILAEIQEGIYQRALAYRDSMITPVNTMEEFQEVLENKGGFISAHWDGTTETELKIKELTKATIRCIPLDNPQEDGTCILTGNPSTQRVLFAKAY